MGLVDMILDIWMKSIILSGGCVLVLLFRVQDKKQKGYTLKQEVKLMMKFLIICLIPILNVAMSLKWLDCAFLAKDERLVKFVEHHQC